MKSRAAMLAFAAGACLPLGACVHAPRSAAGGMGGLTEAIESPQRRLEALAELEIFEPNAPGAPEAAATIDPTLPQPLQPGSIGYADAARPLDQILADLRPGTPAGELPTPTADESRTAAVLYARARAARLSGDADSASEALARAVEIDPASAVLWNELGETRYALGDRAGAVDAWQTAAELGGAGIRPLLLLASDGSQRGDPDDTVRWAGAAWERAEAPSDQILAGSMLGAALLDRGNFHAGTQALGRTLEQLRAYPPTPGEPSQLTALRARLPELAIRLGDGWVRLGHPDRAAEAYEQGQTPDGRVSIPILQRTLAALVLAGRPAEASLRFLDHLASASGDLGTEEIQWLQGLASIPRVGPVALAASESMLDRTGLTDTQRRQILRTVLRSHTPDDAASLARRHPALMSNPVTAGGLLLRLDAGVRAETAIRAVRDHPDGARAWGAALARLDPAPADLAARLRASPDPAGRQIGDAIAAEYQLGLAFEDAPTPESPSHAAMLAEVAGRNGSWEAASALLDAAASAPPADRIAALIACQRLDEARALADACAQDPSSGVDELLASAEVAFVLGDAGAATERVMLAGSLDPFDERVWERRVALLSGADATPEQTRAVGRALAERRVRGALFGLLRARDIAGQGRFRDACELIVLLNDREPTRDLGLGMLAQFSAAGDDQDPGLSDRVVDWMTRRQRAFPGSVPSAIALAQALHPNNPARALEVLDRAAASTGHPEPARSAELLLQSNPDLGERAEDRVLARTANRAGVDASIERAEACLRVARWSQAAESCLGALPPAGQLTAAQSARWRAAAGALSRAPQAEVALERVLGVYDAAEPRGLLDDSLQRQRALVLARLGRIDRLRALVRDGALGTDSGVIVVQALLAAERQADAIDLLAELAIAGEQPDPELLSEWGRLVGAVGDADRVRAMFERIERRPRADLAASVAAALRQAFGFEDSPGEPSDAGHLADVAYAAALVANVFNRAPQSEAMYRLALEHDPAHAWACNDLGYALADRGESLEEAEELILRAVAALPDRASILDSLGWVRYKLGVFDDQLNPDGSVRREGAIGILTRALSAEEGAENATLHEHLGDALWRAGRPDEAAASWRSAESLLRRRAIDLASQPEPNQARIAENQDRMNQLRRRLEAAERGEDPPVAPLGAGEHPG